MGAACSADDDGVECSGGSWAGAGRGAVGGWGTAPDGARDSGGAGVAAAGADAASTDDDGGGGKLLKLTASAQGSDGGAGAVVAG